MDRDYFSNLSFPCPKEAPTKIWATLAQRLQTRSFEILNIFPYKCMGPYKCKGKQTWSRKRQCTPNILAILVDFPCPMICTKIQPQGILGSREEDFKSFFFHIWARRPSLSTILAIFRFSNLRRLYMKFEQNWLSGFRGEVVWKC